MKFSLSIILIALAFNFNVVAQNAIIKAGHIIDSYNDRVLTDKVLIVENGKIIGIEEYDYLDKNGKYIDLSNSWISPGLIDCHVHLTLNLSYRNFDLYQRYIQESNAYRALRGSKNAKELLYGGFTTIKEIGSDGDYVSADIIKAIKNGWIQGPNIVYSGKIIAPYGGQTKGVSIENEGFWKYEFIDADSKDEIRKAIRKNIYYGANCIKLVSGDQPYYYSKEDIEFAVNEAKNAGFKLTVHALNDDASKNTILGGAAAIEHGFFLSNEVLELMKEHGTYLVGTDFSVNNWYAYGMDNEGAMKFYELSEDRLKRAYKIGVKMAFGSDIIIDLEGKNRLESNLDVLTTWKAANIPEMYILKCLTSNAAELLGIDNQQGKLIIGYIADIVAFNKNPLEDITNINAVNFVMKNGIVIRNDF